MTDETRAIRDMMTKIIYENLDGVRNMNKYDTMVTKNRQWSEEKIAQARKAIRELQMGQERITVPKLMKMTGLSRGFFYENTTVRKEMDDAVQDQVGLIDPRKAIIDRTMEGRLELLEQKVMELQREKEELKKRNAKLQKAVDRMDLNFIKNL